MSVSDWLLSALCVLGLIIAIQVGLVWRILSEFIGIANRIRDIGMEVFGIKHRIDILIAHAQSLISDSTRKKRREINMDNRETNMDHLKSIKSSKEMAKILNDAPWCPSANGFLCVDPNGDWKACERCRIKWLDAPYEEEF